MERSAFGLVVVFALIVSSCSSDDGEHGDNYANVLMGTWKLTSILIESDLDLDDNGSASNDLLVETSGCYSNNKIVLESNQFGRAYSSSYLKITTDSQTNEYSSECIPNVSSTSLTFLATQNTVTIEDSASVISGVLSNNAQTMTFTRPTGFTIKDENAVVVLREDVSLVFTKQEF